MYPYQHILLITLGLILWTCTYCQNILENETCPSGTYGSICQNYCWCNMDRSINNTCDREGQCYCHKGFKGLYCHKELSQRDDDDRKTSEVCDCKWYLCRNGTCICNNQKYGTRCEQEFNCTNGSPDRYSTDGSCMCQTGWMGSKCDRPCQCDFENTFPGTNRECTKYSKCKCIDNYYGIRCEKKKTFVRNQTEYFNEKTEEIICKKGYWGKNCEKSCGCNLVGILGCNQINGACKCAYGYIGKQCDTDYGELCNCNLVGSKSRICIKKMCQCKDGYIGKKCEKKQK